MDTEHIKKTIESILESTGVGFSIEVHDQDSVQNTRFLIVTDEPQLLIGPKGAHLSALSHIVRKIIEKDIDYENGERMRFTVDINNYQEKRLEHIRNKARILAERARAFKSDIEMDPMTPYERMIVHSVLSELKDIKTESLGEGRQRRVVIKFTLDGGVYDGI